MTSDRKSARRRPKGDKRERTRMKLLEATREVTREKGYQHATMEDIARRAGMTTGAIYSNFRNREELFIALSETYWPPVKPPFKPGSDFPTFMRAYAKATIAVIPERRVVAVGFLTGRAFALTDEKVRRRARDYTAKSYDTGAVWLRNTFGDLPMRPEILVRVIHALTEGLVLQRLLTPELVPDEVFYAAFETLAGKRSSSPSRRGTRSSAK
jgi:AcrR family transcriptional regulator